VDKKQSSKSSSCKLLVNSSISPGLRFSGLSKIQSKTPIRVYGECLGTRSRRRTQEPAKRLGELANKL